MKQRLKLLGTLFVAVLLGACGLLKENAEAPTTTTVQETTQAPRVEVKADGTYTVKEYTFVSNGKKIYARAYIPDIQGQVPLVVYSHGLGASVEHDEEVQKTLAKSGVAVFSFEFAGGSSSSSPKSEGATTEMSVLTELQNLRDALQFARSLPFVKTDRIYLMGSSQGGFVSALLAQEAANLAGVFLLYPAFSLPDDIRSTFPSLDAGPETFNLLGTKISKKYIADVYPIDAYEGLSKISAPVHIYHGADDFIVPITASKKAIKSLKDARLTTLDDTGHSLTAEQQAQIGLEIADEIFNGMK